MTKRMLIDASHAEETRVVVLDGNRLEEFDIETENKRPLKGNIYLAKVVRVEPSLQAAFVEYGGNRHGFLAFGEIHPDYYQIPVADRERLLAMQAAEEAEEEDDEEEVSEAEAEAMAAAIESLADADATEGAGFHHHNGDAPHGDAAAHPSSFSADAAAPEEASSALPGEPAPDAAQEADPAAPKPPAQAMTMAGDSRSATPDELLAMEAAGAEASIGEAGEAESIEEEGPAPESIGGRGNGDAEEAVRERRIPPRFLRHYKIQEVIRRRQIMLVQVVKEERGNKGAALTTYISLAGRFSVLMPNSPRGGGISRKITSANDRKRLREVISELNMPRGMSLIVRTAGAARPKPEIRRDCEYLLRLWDDIRERTLESVAPALVYEEADLIKRSIRDVFSRDVEEIQVEGEEAFRQARDFMSMLMPQAERKIRLYKDPTVPLFARHNVDQQLDAMMSPVVQLRSGGYIVINQTEALVAIDVNSGRATRDRHIEDTALRTNCEAAEEIARQLRLRDLAGLIVIDFIDMESSRNDAMVERRLKEALKDDRARIQVGRISHFGLLEMSRQRLRPSLTEHSFITCPHCQGLGIVRSPESSALQVLRQIEEEGARGRASEIVVHAAPDLAMHILNKRRGRLSEIEARYSMAVLFQGDASLLGPAVRIERTRAPLVAEAVSAPAALRMDYAPEPEPRAAEPRPAEPRQAEPRQAEPRIAEAVADALPAAAAVAPPGEAATAESAEGENRRRRRRRRRRGGRREDGQPMTAAEQAAEEAGEAEGDDEEEAAAETAEAAPDTVAETAPAAGSEEEEYRSRRRGRRGGRRRREEGQAEPQEGQQPAARYAGPTPADPFAGTLDDLFDAMAAAEEAAQQAASRGPVTVPIQSAPPPAPEAMPAPVAETVPPEAPSEVPLEAPQAAAPEAPAEAPAEAAPAKPARRRSSKAKAEPEAAPEAVVEAAPAKPARRRSSKAKVEAEAAVTEAPPAEAPAAGTPAAEAAPAKPVRRRGKAKVEAEPVAAAPEPAPAPAPEPAPEAAPAPAAAAAEEAGPVAGPVAQPVLVEAATDAPKKRGWWKR